MQTQDTAAWEKNKLIRQENIIHMLHIIFLKEKIKKIQVGKNHYQVRCKANHLCPQKNTQNYMYLM